MSRGIPKKVSEAKVVSIEEIPVVVETVVAPVKRDMKPLSEKKEISYPAHIAESRKALLHPLEPGQKFFESPDGEIIVGEADKGHVWSRRMNNGKGGWINERR